MALQDELRVAAEDDVWITALFVGAEFPGGDDRKLFAAGLLAQVHEHVMAVRVLLNGGNLPRLFGSTCALIRPMLEGFVRALWILDCATDGQVAHRMIPENDDEGWNPGLLAMARAVDARAETGGFLSGLLDKYYDAMCSYAHGGLRVAANHVIEGAIEPRASDEEMAEIVHFARLIELMITKATLKLCGKDEAALACQERLRAFLGEPHGVRTQ